jgi:hypothetical protein
MSLAVPVKILVITISLMFNTIVDVMSVMIKNSVILQYAHGIIFLLEEGFENARNLKFLLYLFEQMSSLKINFLKNEVYCLGAAKEHSLIYEKIFYLQIWGFTFEVFRCPH